MTRFLAIGVYTVSSLTACASSTQPHLNALQSVQPTLTSPIQFEYAAVEVNKKTRMKVTPESQVYQFDTGKSFFAALHIPAGGAEYVNVTTKLIGQWIPTSHMFMPILMFLDRDHQPVQTVEAKIIHNPRFMAGLDYDSQTSVPAGANYLVIYSDPSNYGKSVLFDPSMRGGSTQGVAMPGGGLVFVDTPAIDGTRAGPTGDLWVEFTDTVLELQ